MLWWRPNRSGSYHNRRLRIDNRAGKSSTCWFFPFEEVIKSWWLLSWDFYPILSLCLLMNLLRSGSHERWELVQQTIVVRNWCLWMRCRVHPRVCHRRPWDLRVLRHHCLSLKYDVVRWHHRDILLVDPSWHLAPSVFNSKCNYYLTAPFKQA